MKMSLKFHLIFKKFNWHRWHIFLALTIKNSRIITICSAGHFQVLFQIYNEYKGNLYFRKNSKLVYITRKRCLAMYCHTTHSSSSYKSSSLCLTFFTIEEPTVACLSTLTSFSIPRILSQISAWRYGQSFPMHTLTLLKNSFSGIVFKTAIHQRCQDNLSTKCHWKWEVSCILTIFSLFDTHRKRDTPVLPAQA